MSSEYSKSRIKNCVTNIGNLLKSEISRNKDTKDYLDRLKDEKYDELYDELQLKTDTKLLSKDEINSELTKYLSEYFYNLERSTLFRNYLLLLFFMKSIKSDFVTGPNKDKTLNDFFISNIDEENRTITYKTLLHKLIYRQDGLGEAKYKDTSIIQKLFDKFTDTFIYSLDDKIINKDSLDFNFDDLLEYNEDYQKINRDNIDDSNFEKATINQFINNIIPLTTIHITDAIRAFFDVYETSYGNSTIPDSLSSFLRYYIYNDSYKNRNNTNSVYLSGVGITHTISKIISDSKTSKGEGFGRKLDIGTNDSNIISQQIRLIHYRINTNNFSEFVSISNRDILDNTDDKYDVVISIPPAKLDTLTIDKLIPKDTIFGGLHEEERYKEFNPLPTNDLSSFIYFYDSMKLSNNKVMIVVPLSFLNTNQYKNIDLDEQIESGLEIKRNKINEAYIHARLVKKIIEEQHIKKIMLLPKDTVLHTNQQCVLIECSNNTNQGIHFIDSTERFTQNIEGKSVLDNNKYRKKLKDVYDFKGSNCYVDGKSAIVKSDSDKTKYLVNKFISYDDIINKFKYNLSPKFYLNDGSEFSESSENLKPLDEYFDIFKLQQFKVEHAAKGMIELKFYSKNEFSEFGITESTMIDESIESIVNLSSKKYVKFNKVYDGDILIFVNYKNKLDITYVSIAATDKNEYLAKHNLMVLRLKNSKNSDFSKSVFMYLMSKSGEAKLQSLTTRTNANKPLLSIDNLKSLNVDFYSEFISENSEKFRKVDNQIKKINQGIKNLENIYS